MQIARLDSSVNTGSVDFPGHILHVQTAIDEFNFIKPGLPGHSDRVFHTGRIAVLVVAAEIERAVVVGIIRADREIVLIGANVDFGMVETLLRSGAFHCVHFDFVAVPCTDVHRSVDVLDLNTALRRERVRVVKLLGKNAFLIRSFLIRAARATGDQKDCRECAQHDGLRDCQSPLSFSLSLFQRHNASVAV